MRAFRVGLLAAIAAVACLGSASLASANNLDLRTATNVAKQIAKKECQKTSGCKDYLVRRMKSVSAHKTIGKIITLSVKNGAEFACTRQIVIKLDHGTGKIFYGTSARRCKPTG